MSKPYILKATQSADSAFSISKILRKKCANRDDKILRQKSEKMLYSKIRCQKKSRSVFIMTRTMAGLHLHFLKLIIFAFSDNFSAENSKSSAEFKLQLLQLLGVPPVTKSAVFLNIVQKGGGVISMFKNFGANFV